MNTLGLQLQQILATVTEPLMELLAPARCGICEVEGALICADCRAEWLSPHVEEISTPGCESSAALGPYVGGLGAAIRTMKYGGIPAIADELGVALAPAINCVARASPHSVVLVPVPTDALRVHERGFDHAFNIAAAAAAVSGVPIAPLLIRTRNTPPLHGAGRAERAATLRGAMAVRPALTPPPAVILIDDVQTSGATVAEAARVLRAAGTIWVGAVSVAHER